MLNSSVHQSLGEQCLKSIGNDLEGNLEKNNEENIVKSNSIDLIKKMEEESNKSQDLKDCLTDGEQKAKLNNDRLDIGNKKEVIDKETGKEYRKLDFKIVANDQSKDLNRIDDLRNGLSNKLNIDDLSKLTASNVTLNKCFKQKKGESEEGDLVKERLNYLKKEEELVRSLKMIKKRKINQSATYGKAEEEANKYNDNIHLNELKRYSTTATMNKELDLVQIEIVQKLDQKEEEYNDNSFTKCNKITSSIQQNHIHNQQPLDGQLGNRHANIYNDKNVHKNESRNDHCNTQQESTTSALNSLNENSIPMKKINSTKRLRINSPNLITNSLSNSINSNANLVANLSTNLLFHNLVDQSGN